MSRGVARWAQTGIRSFQGGAYDIWEIDLSRGARPRLTLRPSTEAGTSEVRMDGRCSSARIREDRQGVSQGLVRVANALAIPPCHDAGAGRRLTRRPHVQCFPSARRGLTSGHRRPMVGTGHRYCEESFDEERCVSRRHAMSYHSNVSGVRVYVGAVPADGSADCAYRPTECANARWSHDGRELFYLGGDGRLMRRPFAGLIGFTPARRRAVCATNPLVGTSTSTDGTFRTPSSRAPFDASDTLTVVSTGLHA
jgi:hypothetical protein